MAERIIKVKGTFHFTAEQINPRTDYERPSTRYTIAFNEIVLWQHTDECEGHEKRGIEWLKKVDEKISKFLIE